MQEVVEEGTAIPKAAVAGNYFSQDFVWEDLRDEIEQSKVSENRLVSTQNFGKECTVEAWNRFHRIHAKHTFFKERRYLVKEFPELLSSDKELIVLEIGCGTGSSALPVIRANDKAIVYACDCCESALETAKELVSNAISSEAKCRFFPFHCDIATQSLPTWLHYSSCRNNSDVLLIEDGTNMNAPPAPPNWNMKPFSCLDGVDIAMMIFTLSSIPPCDMRHVIKECFKALKPGGLVLFRDYGLYDMTMLRFSPAQRVGEHLFQRGDGTLSYFFSQEVLRDLFTQEGFVEEDISFCCVQLKNRQKALPMKRVWIHAKFSKPEMTKSLKP